MKVLEIKEIIATKWVSLKEATFLDKNNKAQKWIFAERVGNPKVVAIIAQSVKTGKYLIIRQPRVPIGTDILEFPAGLVDPEESLEKGARRELKEETGYIAKIKLTSPMLAKSAGLTNEKIALVYCEIEAEEQQGETEMEEVEDIHYMWLSVNEFFTYIEKEGISSSNELYAFMWGLKLARTTKSTQNK